MGLDKKGYKKRKQDMKGQKDRSMVDWDWSLE
jgi:hypothetical protein